MKFSTALITLAAVAGGASAFQSSVGSSSRVVATANRAGGALMAATMDGTSAGVKAMNGEAQVAAGGMKRKKTKQVSLIILSG